MKSWLKYFSWKNFRDTWGMYAMANILICTISGIFLTIPYDVNAPYESISRFILLIPGATFIRNLHFWSAQLFLIFTILHLWDHFKKKTEKNLSIGIWFRLTLAIAISFFVMLSGFIVKGDADSIQARQILDKLLTSVPFVGTLLSRTIIGDSFQLLYVHHIATATIILFILIYEHARIIWAKARIVFFFLFILAAISIFLQAPLHDNIKPVLKGPWYFVGFQEILHLFAGPTVPLIIGFTILTLVFLIRILSFQWSTIIKKLIYSLFGIYLFLSIIGYFFRGESWKWINPLQENYSQQVYFPHLSPLTFNIADSIFDQRLKVEVYNRSESCLACHEQTEGFTASHHPASIGCASCHGGDIFSMNKRSAHHKMHLIPGQLNNVAISCGTANCHPDISNRMKTNIMTTMSGVVSVDKWVFGEYDHQSILSDIKELGNSPADIHLKNLCSSCHLGNNKKTLGAIDESSRGGGCIACHLTYDNKAKSELHSYLDSTKTKENFVFNFHPSIDMNVTDDHCFGCHNRSGRISLSYEGWHETGLHADSIEDKGNYRILKKRVLEYIQEDIHHSKGLMCIDCHTSYELMGDGNKYAHKEDQLQIQCEDCHLESNEIPKTTSKLTTEESLILALRNYGQKDHRFLEISKSERALINSYVDSLNNTFLYTKTTSEKRILKRIGTSCTNNAHKDLSCSACHTSWVPRCIGCHNEYDPNVNGTDLWTGKKTQARWFEYVAEFIADKPTLGVRMEEGKREIITMMPGMITTIDLSKYDKKEIIEKHRFERLYAPAAPHTTITPKNNCKSCHHNPIMIGYGAGELKYHINDNLAHWEFTPFYSNLPQDDLPADAWIGFLMERNKRTATRDNIKPFNLVEQKRMLLIASCFECHDQSSKEMQQSLVDFDSLLMERSEKCIMPNYP